MGCLLVFLEADTEVAESADKNLLDSVKQFTTETRTKPKTSRLFYPALKVFSVSLRLGGERFVPPPFTGAVRGIFGVPQRGWRMKE